MMKKQTVMAVLVAATAATPIAAFGEKSYQADEWRDNRWYITPFGGYVFSDDDRKAADDEGSWQVGAAIGKPVSEKWNLELRGFYEELDEDNGPGKYENWGMTLDGHWYFLRNRGVNDWGGFQPYLILGAGFMQDKVDDIDKDDYSFIANGGLGVNWAFSNWGRLVADARYRWDDNSGDILDEDDFQDVVVSLGLQIPLGAAPVVAAAPVVMPEPEPQPVVVEPVQHSFELSADALFSFDSSELTALGRSRIDEIVKTVRGTGFTANSVEITGHTDPLGPEAYNQTLSEQRAEVVRDYLVSQDIPSTVEVTTRGVGEAQPKVTVEECRARGEARTKSALIACLAPNRRVEAVVSGTQAR